MVVWVVVVLRLDRLLVVRFHRRLPRGTRYRLSLIVARPVAVVVGVVAYPVVLAVVVGLPGRKIVLNACWPRLLPAWLCPSVAAQLWLGRCMLPTLSSSEVKLSSDCAYLVQERQKMQKKFRDAFSRNFDASFKINYFSPPH